MRNALYLSVLVVACSTLPQPPAPNCSASSAEIYAEGVRLLDEAPLNVDRKKGLAALERERAKHKAICER